MTENKILRYLEVPVTKANLIEQILEEYSSLDKAEATKIVNLFFDTIIESLAKGEKVELRGFGSFRVKKRDARIGRNPKTGEKVNVPSKMIPFFKPGKLLKTMIDK